MSCSLPRSLAAFSQNFYNANLGHTTTTTTTAPRRADPHRSCRTVVYVHKPNFTRGKAKKAARKSWLDLQKASSSLSSSSSTLRVETFIRPTLNLREGRPLSRIPSALRPLQIRQNQFAGQSVRQSHVQQVQDTKMVDHRNESRQVPNPKFLNSQNR